MESILQRQDGDPGEIYTQKIVPPSPKQLIDHTAENLERILKLDTYSGGKVQQDRSTFEAYTACVSSHKEIRDLYIKIKLMVPVARHVVCAYWIKGDPIFSQDYCDDGEPNAGRTLLNFM